MKRKRFKYKHKQQKINKLIYFQIRNVKRLKKPWYNMQTALKETRKKNFWHIEDLIPC